MSYDWVYGTEKYNFLDIPCPKTKRNFFFKKRYSTHFTVCLFLFERDVPMTPYHHLRSQHCNASWRGQFMYIAQLAPHTTFNTLWVWLCGAVGPHAWRLSQCLIRNLHFKFINILTTQRIETRSPGQKSRALTFTPRIHSLFCSFHRFYYCEYILKI